MSGREHLHPVPDRIDQEVEIVQAEVAFGTLPAVMWQAPVDVIEDLKNLHTSLIESLRRDAQHLPTGTIAAMQLERVAYFYIRLRYHEMLGNWPNPRYREHLYKLWRDSANDLVSASQSSKISPEALHKIVSSHTARVVANVLQTIPREQANPLYRKFAAELEAGEPA